MTLFHAEKCCHVVSANAALPDASTYSQGTWRNLGETRAYVGWGKSGVLEHCSLQKRQLSLKRIKIEEKLPWRAYRNSPTLFRMNGTIPDPPTGSSSPIVEVRNPHPKLQSLLSQEWVKLWTSNLASTFIGSIWT